MRLRYPGLSPSNVNKDAKYSVVSGVGGRMEVRLVYRVSRRERDLLTTDRHDRLVNMVNAVKEEVNGAPGGAFYINEFRDVLVPDNSGGCIYAGSYDESLTFDYEGRSIGPVPPAGVVPGDGWPGPHVGIRYVLSAGGADIKYELVQGRRHTERYLSDDVGASAAAELARRLAKVKTHAGGRLYINEAAHFFAPMDDGEAGVSYVYLGELDEDMWFPPPDVPGRP